MSKRKPIIAMDISTSGKGGGPYTSTINLINSSLKEDYDYRIFKYDTSLGRFISFKRIKDITRQLKEIKPDIVHFTGLQLSGFHIAVACKIARIPSVVVIRGSSTEAQNIGKIKKTVMGWLEFITLMLVDTYYGVSEYSSEISYTKYFKRKSIGCIYNLPPSFSLCKTFKRSDFGLLDTDFVVVSVGRIVKDKGCHILSKSIKDIDAKKNNIKYIIVGDGECLLEMKMYLASDINSGQILFLGYRDDVNAILPLCDVFILPTLHETLSNALLEASRAKLALIASNTGGIPEIVENDVNGLLITPGNSQELAEAIWLLYNDRNKCKEMGMEAYKKIHDKFSEKSIVARIDSMYKKLLSEK